jgi:hypothetical protein
MAIGVDRMQRNFEPMRRQVEEWRPIVYKFKDGAHSNS